jgi:hypothetical protein
MPLYCFCGFATKNAISRPTHNKIVPNEVIQLNFGARVSGYSSSVGVAVLHRARCPSARSGWWSSGWRLTSRRWS